MIPRDFSLERYFARYEFSTRYLLCSSDPESLSTGELLALEPDAGAGLRDVWLGYTQSLGDPDLRRAIAASYASVDAENVLVHCGAEEPIFSFANVALQPGDGIVFQFPAYQSHYSVAQALGVEASRWKSDLARGGAPDPDDLADLIGPNTRAIVLTSPNNPTGYAFDRERLDAVVALARKRGLWLFSDEVYRGSEREPEARHPSVCDLYERGISLGGMAKAYGLPGLRIGWVATRDRTLYRKMAEFKDYVTICNAAPSEFLAKLALRHQDWLLERIRKIVLRNLELLDEFFAARSDLFQWHRPPAGTTAFPRYLGGSSESFCHELARKAGVLLLPSTVFDAGDDRIRIGYARANLPEALAAFEAALPARR
ncbi:MAG TPA: aminotransferase class I/II-fold pyridoxal phosphate-dependent enzyme [Candidatus Tumulicola sp.]|jgi:aspartate/methionine/tyrosine aminotransferase